MKIQQRTSAAAAGLLAPAACLVAFLAAAPAQAQRVEIPAARIAVTLSAKAQAKLAKSGEQVHILGSYYGVAIEGRGNEEGQVDLGTQEADILGPGAVTFGARSIPAAALADVRDRTPRLLVNVYTSRKVFEDNLLDCGIYEGPADASSIIEIACKLIGEN